MGRCFHPREAEIPRRLGADGRTPRSMGSGGGGAGGGRGGPPAIRGLLVVVLCGAAAPPPFQKALPGYRFQFPRDHAAHEAFRTEWWYYTGHVRTARGEAFGFQVTFFRVGIAEARESPSRWAA